MERKSGEGEVKKRKRVKWELGGKERRGSDKEEERERRVEWERGGE